MFLLFYFKGNHCFIVLGDLCNKSNQDGEQTATVIHVGANIRHIQICDQSNYPENFLYHAFGKSSSTPFIIEQRKTTLKS